MEQTRRQKQVILLNLILPLTPSLLPTLHPPCLAILHCVDKECVCVCVYVCVCVCVCGLAAGALGPSYSTIEYMYPPPPPHIQKKAIELDRIREGSARHMAYK
jgi:hypothetical protein